MISIAIGSSSLTPASRAIPLVAGEKRAAIKWKEFQSTAPSEEQIIEWFSGAERDIALVTGNGVVVVDIDDPGLLPMVLQRCGTTPMRCRTPSGGMHLYYGMRPGIHYGNAVGIKGKPVDLRCEGAYAVCPWSRRGDGVPYEWLQEPIPAASLPPVKISWLREKSPKRLVTPADLHGNPGSAVRRARRYLWSIEGAISGYRGHNRTFRVACVLTIKFGLTLEQAWPLFLEWNEQCEPPWSEKELLHKLQDALKERTTSWRQK